MEYVYRVFDKLYETSRLLMKWILRKMTGKGELERICSMARQSYVTTLLFAHSLKKSKQLKNVSSIIFYPKPFTITRVLPLIVETKRLNEQTTDNAVLCLNDLRIINLIFDKIDTYRKLKLNEQTKENVYALLDELWIHLKPDIRRKSDGYVSDDWPELGFQGKDPTTDFRGMGLLGLYQLVHFCKTRPETARKLLLECDHPRRFLPFAATGINVTGFVSELISECRLYRYVLHNVAAVQECQPFDQSTALERDVVARGVVLVNDLYCDLFESLLKLWVAKDPPNVMSFQIIFREFKLHTKSRLCEV